MAGKGPTTRANLSASPPLSVVMPVHNALPYLDEAIDSILGQTFGDFEFVILDDASNDGSKERLRQWAERDSRIRLLEVEENLGPVRSSNMVATAATAPVVARMDADDISFPTRLAEELELLRAHEGVGLVASLCDMIDAEGRRIREPELWRLSRRSPFVPFAHGAIMYRRAVFEEVGRYREEAEYWEDQDLIVRMAAVADVAVIPRPLYRVRQTATSTRAVCGQENLELALDRAYDATEQIAAKRASRTPAEGAGANPRKLHPRVFIALGSLTLWSGGRPRLFRRFLSRANLSWNIWTANALIWTAWASASPSTLRLFLMMLLRMRNLLTIGMPTDRPVRWRPLRGAEAMQQSEAQP
jgi:glycosyltransferase involved in cell wall biosynthesis